MPVVRHTTLLDFGAAIFTAAGVPADQARIAIGHLVEANLVGHDSHGVMRLAGYTGALLKGDIAPVGGEPYQSPKLTSKQAILDLFDANVAAAKKAFTAVRDQDMGVEWSLLQAGTPIIVMPRAAVIRSFVLNHTIHHRAILCVYLRLNDIPVPGMYGPSGDE
jgi:hypothetical protein